MAFGDIVIERFGDVKLKGAGLYRRDTASKF